ncbi:hypothetical protein AMR72_08610 [Flavobacterium psychrophilum]|nr:hypothetical protein AMR72_08610 [Flavobacterium psychrophilum]AOE52560.1 hypothetical protein ALW18_08600 [Flavobacterium psychrophilum]
MGRTDFKEEFYKYLTGKRNSNKDHESLYNFEADRSKFDRIINRISGYFGYDIWQVESDLSNVDDLTRYVMEDFEELKASNESYITFNKNTENGIPNSIINKHYPAFLQSLKHLPMTFDELVTNLRENQSIHFRVLPHKPGTRWVWIRNNSNPSFIGNNEAHYEVIMRYRRVYVELHFEGSQKQKDIFYQNLQLPKDLNWIDWQNSKSISYVDNYSLNDPKIVENIVKALDYMEEVLGNDVRDLIYNHPTDTFQSDNRSNLNSSLNQILYGPPGTGKTFNTINRALEITGGKLEAIERPEVKKMFDEKLEQGQIVFTTFHQNMSYEDFIEGIKPKEVNGGVIYRTEEGIFKIIARKAFNNILSKNAVVPALTFDTLHQEFLKEIEPCKGTEDYIFSTLQGSKLKYVDLKGSSIKVKFRYTNAKSKVAATEEFTITKDKLKQLFEAGVDPDNVKTLRETFRPFFKHNLSVYYAVYKKFYDFAKEHYDAEEIEDISNDRSFVELKEDWDNIEKVQQDELLLKADNFVIIIDEINRGNVSKIFGELITLIEESKRLGKPEAITAKLPYSKDEFSVPPNLHIIGTMNTADRSVEALDTALRRRFDFEEFPPQPELLNGYARAFGHEVKEILIKLNKRIEVLLNKDNLIGHSFFMVDEKDQNNGEVLEKKVVNAFHKNIIPLLQEYFYGDYNKIGLVLGSKFVSKKDVEKAATLFASDKEFGGSDYIGDNFIYCIEDISKDDFDFQKAIDVLMDKVSTVTTDEA